jgi:hypothetical protein
MLMETTTIHDDHDHDHDHATTLMNMTTAVCEVIISCVVVERFMSNFIVVV